ncbi:MAG: F0F1 ATP synthase subunit delta [Puniceicoccales bacterium]|jgi:F-type H+-transporting ATPase subunit delta|nr:F0F1 ATP synthase subunit delta [Puniceicoccales bacterium]
MLSKKKVTTLAKKLAQLSFDGAEIDLSRVRAIAELMAEFAETVRRSLQRKYLHFLENECHRFRLSIEYVDGGDFISIQRFMERHMQRKLRLETTENRALIAGLRISVGDCIWERSIRGDLSALCS